MYKLSDYVVAVVVVVVVGEEGEGSVVVVVVEVGVVVVVVFPKNSISSVVMLSSSILNPIKNLRCFKGSKNLNCLNHLRYCLKNCLNYLKYYLNWKS